MFPFTSTLAQFVGERMLLTVLVVEAIVAHPPRMPFTFVPVVVILPEPPNWDGVTKLTAPPLFVWRSRPRFKTAVPPVTFVTWMRDWPRSKKVLLKFWVTLPLALLVTKSWIWFTVPEPT